MFIRFFSDIHAEFEPHKHIDLPQDKETVCVLAGDVGVVEKIQTIRHTLDLLAPKFRAVIYVLGNHEHYHGSILRSYNKVAELIKKQGYTNVHLLENQTVVIDDVAFIGATLWTDFDNWNPLFVYNVTRMMNDYRVIRYGVPNDPFWRAVRPADIFQYHIESKNFIFSEVAKHKANGLKTVVVTHHGVTPMSIDPVFKGHNLNPAYMSDLSEYILDTQPLLMIHGHIHASVDYMVGETRVVANPKGYPGETGLNGHEPEWLIEV